MRVFRTADGHFVQLIDIETIKTWNPELPLIFIGFIRDKKLGTYHKSIQKDVEKYLDDILEHVAIPKLTESLYSPDLEQRLIVARNIAALSESNPDQLQIALPHIEKAKNVDPNKEVKALMDKALKNYAKAQKKKQTAAKRKQLTDLRKNMDKFDELFAEGKISDADYVKEQKKYLKLKREIELEENVD
jgi:hypothetical protein